MRTLLAITLAVTLLPAGKPAGVKPAMMTQREGALYLTGVTVVGGGLIFWAIFNSRIRIAATTTSSNR